MAVRREAGVAEREQQKLSLAVGLRVFARHGFDFGVAGHISARDALDPDTFWVNPFGADFAAIRASDLLLLNGSGELLAGDGQVNRSAFLIHAQIHSARPDCLAVAHAHSIYGMAWSTLGRTLAPLTQNACAFYDDHVLVPYQGPVLAEDEGAHIARTLAHRKAAILENHGLLTLGASVEEAVWWFIVLERSCQIQLLAEAAGTPNPVTAEIARRAYSGIGTPEAARRSAAPLFARVLREEPDVGT